MFIRFWGVRGSVPCPGPNTVKYGGNTSCIEIRLKESNRLIIIDAGSGIRELGNYLISHDFAKGPIQLEIFITHTHWDHILGFPFFTPAYLPKTKLRIYGPVTFENESIGDIIGGQMTYRYFPIRQSELASEIEYISIKEERIDLGGGLYLQTKYLNHPILCLGYRFEYRGKSVCIIYDTEPFYNVFSSDPDDPSYDEAMDREGEVAAKEENRRIEDFYSGSDLLIHDAQYDLEEYRDNRIGWGHSPIESVISAARRAKVNRLALFHHDPERTDEELDNFTEKYCGSVSGNAPEILFAKEGDKIEL